MTSAYFSESHITGVDAQNELTFALVGEYFVGMAHV